MLPKHHKGSPYSPRAHAQCKMPRSTMGPLRAVTEPVQAWGNLHNLIGGSQVITTKGLNLGAISTTPLETPSNPPSRLGFQEPKGNKLRVQAPESNKLLTFTQPNLRRELKPMQQMQWQEHKCSSPSLPNPTTTTNAMEEYERKNKGGNPQKTPRSRSKRFPSLGEEIDWCKYRSRSPLSFPSKICKNHGRNQELGQALQGQQWRKESEENDQEEALTVEEEGAFYRTPRKRAVGSH